MAWRIVRQPDGRLARFSDVVDNFTHLDMDFSEAMTMCEIDYGMGNSEARDKVMRGFNDEPWEIDSLTEHCSDGLHRWRDSIATIRLIHGDAAAAEMESRYHP